MSFFAAVCNAADTGMSDDGWHFSVNPYVVLPSADGKVGIGGITGGIDASFSDILDHLDMALMGAASARKGRWIFGFDAQYFKLSGVGTASLQGPFGFIDVDGTAELASPMTILQPTIAYRVFGDGPSFDAYIAARYTSVENTLTLTATSSLPSFPGGEREISGDATWWDPVVGARIVVPITDRLFETTLLDAGGFGVGADVTHQWLAALGWQFNNTFSASVGYRYFKQDYDDDGVIWDMALAGVFIGFGIEF